MEDLEYSGEWWFPEGENRAYGELHFDKHEGGTLELQDSLVGIDQPRSLPQADDIPDRIFGVTQGNTVITLGDTYYNGHSGTSTASGYETTSEDYHIRCVYEGSHLSGDDPLSNLTFSFPGLIEWYNKSFSRLIIDSELPEDVELAEFDLQGAIAFAEPTRIEFEIGDISLLLKAGAHWSSSTRSHEIEDSVSLVLQYDDGKDIGELEREYLRPLRQYFSLALGKPVHPTSMSGRLVDAEMSENEAPNSVEIYIPYPHLRSGQEIKNSDLNFRFSDVDFEQSLRRWFEHFEEAHQLHRFFFGYQYHDSMFLEFQFLSLVVGLESYYEQSASDPLLMDQDEFGSMHENIREAIPEGAEARTRILNLIESIGNYPSLKNQLRTVMSGYHDVINPLIDLDEVASDATDIRHKIAHGLEHPINEEMIRLIPLLSLIVETILYDTIGLEEEHILQILSSKYRHELDD